MATEDGGHTSSPKRSSTLVKLKLPARMRVRVWWVAEEGLADSRPEERMPGGGGVGRRGAHLIVAGPDVRVARCLWQAGPCAETDAPPPI